MGDVMTDVSTKKLDEWIKSRASSRRDRNVVSFLAVRAEVQAGLEAGHAASTLFAYLRDGGQIGFCYDTFLKYVHRYIRSTMNTAQSATPKKQKLPPMAGDPASRVKAKASSEGLPGFSYNAFPNKEDLI